MDGIRAIDHSDTAIEQEDDQQPSAAQPFPGGFLDGVKGTHKIRTASWK